MTDKHPETNQEYLDYWRKILSFMEDQDGLEIVMTTFKGERKTINVHYGLFIWLSNVIWELTCPECKEYKPKDDFVRNGKKCRDCSF